MSYSGERKLRRTFSDPSFNSEEKNYRSRGKYSREINCNETIQYQTAEEGRKLFSAFLQEEINKEGLEDLLGEQAKGDSSEVPLNYGYKTLQWSETGQKLRKLADEFARSNARKEVFRQAEKVNVQTIGKEEFFQLLNELFRGGISRERIIALFFFCSDLAIKVLRQSNLLHYFQQFVKWSLSYICGGISDWVSEHGGWCAVLNSSIRYATMISIIIASLAFTFAVVVYIKRHK